MTSPDLLGPPTPEPDDDPGHLFTDAEWAQIQADAAAAAAAAGPRALGLLDAPIGPARLSMPARFHGGTQTPTLQVVHSAETPLQVGYAVAIGRMFAAGPAAQTSATKMIDPRTVVTMLPATTVGYHVGPEGNRDSLGYEQAGYARFTRAEWTTADGVAQLEILAAELAADGIRYGIPDRRLTDAQLRAWAAAGRPAALGGRVTHDQIHRVLGGTTHTDPMPEYPLDELDAAVTRHRSGAPTPTPTPEGPFMALTDAQQNEMYAWLKNVYAQTTHLDNAGMGALARLDAGLPQVLTTLTAAGVDDAKRDAAVLGAIAALPKVATVDVDALAAALAEHGVTLDAQTIAKAVRADLAGALAGGAA